MHKAVLAGLLVTSLAAPVAAYAQPAVTITPPTISTEQVVVIRPAQWLAIGAGVLVGAAVLDVVLPSQVAFVVGGVVGGYLANVWYTGRQIEIQTGSVPKI